MFFISFILFYSTRRFFKHKISAFTILNQSDRISKTTQISNSEHRLLNRKQCPLPIRVNIYCAPGTSAEKYGDEFYKQIRQFERRGQIIIWNQARIPAGSNQDEEINQATVSVDIAYLFENIELFNLDSFVEDQLPRLIQLSTHKKIKIYRVIANPHAYHDKNLDRIIPITQRDQALSKMSPTKRREIFIELANKIPRC